MKIIITLLLTCGITLAADISPQTVIPRPEIMQQLHGMWFNDVYGCDIVAYFLFDYTDQHPDRVRYSGDDDVATVDGFVEYLQSKSPIIVSDADGHKACLVFYNGAVFTPWGQEIIFLIGRKTDGYLNAFGERASINEYFDPWQKHGFKYSKAVGITLKSRPSFVKASEHLLLPLNDEDYNRLKINAFRR